MFLDYIKRMQVPTVWIYASNVSFMHINNQIVTTRLKKLKETLGLKFAVYFKKETSLLRRIYENFLLSDQNSNIHYTYY